MQQQQLIGLLVVLVIVAAAAWYMGKQSVCGTSKSGFMSAPDGSVTVTIVNNLLNPPSSLAGSDTGTVQFPPISPGGTATLTIPSGGTLVAGETSIGLTMQILNSGRINTSSDVALLQIGMSYPLLVVPGPGGSLVISWASNWTPDPSMRSFGTFAPITAIKNNSTNNAGGPSMPELGVWVGVRGGWQMLGTAGKGQSVSLGQVAPSMPIAVTIGPLDPTYGTAITIAMNQNNRVAAGPNTIQTHDTILIESVTADGMVTITDMP